MLVRLLVVGFGVFTMVAVATAKQPLPERAIPIYASFHLLMPDGSVVPVDMSMDCGGELDDTGIIVTNDKGAALLAEAYRSIYGADAARQVLSYWHNKKTPASPRKPTFLFVQTDVVEVQSTGVVTAPVNIKNNSIPKIIRSCGDDPHPKF